MSWEHKPWPIPRRRWKEVGHEYASGEMVQFTCVPMLKELVLLWLRQIIAQSYQLQNIIVGVVDYL